MLQIDNRQLTTQAFAFGVVGIIWVGIVFGNCHASAPLKRASYPLEQVSNDTPDNVPAENIRNRLVIVGFGIGILLALLGTVFFYLRMNHATRGFYSGRLQLLTFASLIAILVVSYFLWARILFK